eukprot:5052690-Karenia_brevis.AAC.1
MAEHVWQFSCRFGASEVGEHGKHCSGVPFVSALFELVCVGKKSTSSASFSMSSASDKSGRA